MTVKTPKIYDICDVATEAIIYFMMIFSPWAFSTTEPWSIWTMNIAGYLLGLLLLTKWITCRVTGYVPHRWESDASPHWQRFQRLSTRALAGITIFLLAYVLCQALNARADYLWGYGHFNYFDDYIKWLPHSYDQGATWQALFKWSALACVFWAVRDWFTVKSIHERRKFRKDENRERVQPLLNRKLNRFLWILSINAALLALVGILQRFSGTDKLLWLVQPPINKSNIEQFGPWAYRGSAAIWFSASIGVVGWFLYLKLKYVTLGSQVEKYGRDRSLLLVLAFILCASVPFLAGSRLGLGLGVFILLVLASCFLGDRDLKIVKGKLISVSILLALLAGAALLYISKSRFSVGGYLEVTGVSESSEVDFVAEITEIDPSGGAIFSLSSSRKSPLTPFGLVLSVTQSGHIQVRRAGAMIEDAVLMRAQADIHDSLPAEIHLRVGPDDRAISLGMNGHELNLERVGKASATEEYRRSRSMATACFWAVPELGGRNSGIGLRSWTMRLQGTQDERVELNNGSGGIWRRLLSDTGRGAIYSKAREIRADYGRLGVGLGAFAAVNPMYGTSTGSMWDAYVHNDYLQAQVELGNVLTLIAIACFLFALCLGCMANRFHMMVGAGIAAILLSAVFDFPFQTYSVSFQFLMLCSVVFGNVIDPIPSY